MQWESQNRTPFHKRTEGRHYSGLDSALKKHILHLNIYPYINYGKTPPKDQVYRIDPTLNRKSLDQLRLLHRQSSQPSFLPSLIL
jgi:hypothetical protein